MKAPRVRQQRSVDALGYLFSHFKAKRLAEVVDHLADGCRGRVYPVNVAERQGGRVVIDVDDELMIEAWKTGPADVAALDDERRVITVRYVRLHQDQVRSRKHVVSGRHAVAQHNVYV